MNDYYVRLYLHPLLAHNQRLLYNDFLSSQNAGQLDGPILRGKNEFKG
jgi:hypothetical protein